MKNLDGKVAAITGAGSGIGRALAYQLASAGVELALCDINEESLAETVAHCRELSSVRVSDKRVDVAVRAAVHAWADEVARDHGRVNLIFNNAGVGLNATLEGVGYDDFEWIMSINFWGVVHGTKAFLPHLRAAGEGHIVNVSSVFGMCAYPANGAYAATKFAVRGFTEALRQELELSGDKIGVTCVHPGGVKTNIARATRFDASAVPILGDEETAKANATKYFVTEAKDAAATIINAVRKNRARVLIGPDAQVMDVMQRTLPQTYQRIVTSLIRRQQPASKG